VAAAQAPDKEAAEKYNEGLSYLKSKDYEQALTVFLETKKVAEAAGDKGTATKADSYAYRLCYNVGVGYHKLGDYEKALEYFDQGIALEPGYYKNYKGKAAVYKAQGDEAAAMEAYIKTGEVATAAGELEERSKARAQAEGFVAKALQAKDYEKVISNGETFLQYLETADVHYYMAHSFNQTGEYQQALDHAEKALALETGSRAQKAKIHFEKAEAHKNLAQYQLALRAYSEAAYGDFKQRAEHEIEVLAGSQ
jgi:tetratricopeptide (TPR) repeat protein